MPPETENGAVAPEPDLRATLSGAFQSDREAQETPETSSGEDGQQPAVETPAEGAGATDTGRDAQGRFKAKDGQQEQQPGQQPPAGQQGDQQPTAQQPPKADAQASEAAGEGQPLAPPPGWSPTAKEAYAGLPDAVKQAVAKREAEVDQGLAKLRDYKELDPYVDLAGKAGTTLPDALKNYVAAEQLLEKDPVQGIQWLCRTYGVDPAQLAGGQPQQQAQPNGQQPPQGQQQAPQTQAAPQQINLEPHLKPLVTQLNSLKEMVVGERTAKTQAEIGAFFDDKDNHPYADNVADQMASLIKSGVANDLQQAYDMACWNDPEIRELLIKKQQSDHAASEAAKARQAADQARAAGASVSGGSAETHAGATENLPLRESLQRQFAGGRV